MPSAPPLAAALLMLSAGGAPPGGDGGPGPLPKNRPNLLLIVADDLGARDLACYGSPFHETPHLDALAARGVRFTRAYAACPVCSPTRASIFTGRYPARLRLTDWLKGRRQPPFAPILHAEYLDELPLEQVTVAEELKAAGYRTGFVGKWHLGGDGHLPTDQGFDVNVAGGPNGNPGDYFWPGWKKRVTNLEGEFDGQYLTDLLAERSAAFVADAAAAGDPWFLCVCPYQVHTPIQPKPALLEKYEAKLGRLAATDPRYRAAGGDGRGGRPGIPVQNNPHYAAMVESLDDLVGTVVGAVDAAGQTGNTLALFFSDNGGLSVREGPLTPATANAPLRAGKGWLYEGGIREPLIAAGPGVAAGKTCDAAVISNDLRPTLLAAAGVHADPRDGLPLNPLLADPAGVPEEWETRDLFWHYPHFSNQGGAPGGAILRGDRKLIERYGDGSLELYDLEADPSESRNLLGYRAKAKHVAEAGELRAALSDWRRRVNANMPTANPAVGGRVLTP